MRRAFVDVESSGLDPAKDRIVEIAIRLEEPGAHQGFEARVNPGVPIPASATAVHGIADLDVADAPSFLSISSHVQAMLDGSIFIGYNSMRFDVPLVDAELRRAGERGLDRDERGRIVHREIDLYALWGNAEPRSLEVAVRRFGRVSSERAHSAAGDIDVLPSVLLGMAEDLALPSEWEDLELLSKPKWLVDRDGKFRRGDDGRIRLAFGKHRDELASEHVDYLEWLLTADFSAETKSWAMDLIAGSVL